MFKPKIIPSYHHITGLNLWIVDDENGKFIGFIKSNTKLLAKKKIKTFNPKYSLYIPKFKVWKEKYKPKIKNKIKNKNDNS